MTRAISTESLQLRAVGLSPFTQSVWDLPRGLRIPVNAL